MLVLLLVLNGRIPPAVKVIDCVLSLNRKYDTFVVPRLKTFMSNHPEIQRVVELAKLMANYPTPPYVRATGA